MTVSALYSQDQAKADSLLKVYQSATADSNKVKALSQLFSQYRYSNDSLAEHYANLSCSFAAGTSYTRGYALALYNKGTYEGERGNFDSSRAYIHRSLEQYQSVNDINGQASCQMAFGFIEFDQASLSKALYFFLNAARLREKSGNRKDLAGSYIWVGNVYNNGLLKPEYALVYYRKALELQTALGNEADMGYTYNNIGNAYYFLKKYGPALENHLKSARIKERTGNKRGLSASYDNIGNVYFDQQDYTNALAYYQKALTIREEFGDKKGMTSSYVNLGNLYFMQKNYPVSVSYHHKALDDASIIGNRESMVEACNSLSANYEAMGDYKAALIYFRQSASLKDSILNTTYTNQVADMQTRYDVEKKDLEIAKNQAELEARKRQAFVKNIILVSIIVLSIMLASLGIVFYRKKRVEQQARLNAEIAAQKEMRTKAILEAEEKERRRIAQDLHDGVGQLLSAAKLNLSHLDSRLPDKNTDQETAMHNALSLLDDSAKEVRAVSHNMMPNTLIKFGLASAIREFITKLGNAPTLKIDLEIVGLDNRLENQVETVLYRVIQETVNNIIKHAKASQISMQLIRHDTELNVMIEDNGVGFDTSNIDDFGGLGLKGIKTRIELLEGSVHFDSAPGRGTTVIIDVPVKP